MWLVFGLLFVPALMMLWLLGVSKDGASAQLALQQDAIGRSVVLTGVLSDVDTTSGLPRTNSFYDVTIPDSAPSPSAGETVTFGGDEQWGFPPSSDYPAQLDYLVVLDGRPRDVQHGPVGSIEPVTDDTLRAEETGFATQQALWVAGIVVFWIATLGLPALAILLSVRRRRARRSLVTESVHPPRL